MSQEDFDIDSLAAYLHLIPAQVSRMCDRGRLPGRRVKGQWRFSRAEIHHWLEQRIGASEDDELERLENALDRSDPAVGEDDTPIAECLPTEAISLALPAKTRARVITAIADLAAGTNLLWDPAAMVEAVSAREAMQPTALDNGVALLHPRRPLASVLAEPFIAFGRTTQGIPFGSSRGVLTDLFFLICSVSDHGHLRTLARLSRLINDSAVLEDLRRAESPAEVRPLLAAHEERICG